MKKIICFLMLVFCLMCFSSCNTRNESEILADEYANVDSFLKRKNDSNHLAIGKYHMGWNIHYNELRYDHDDTLYDLLKKIEYEEKEINIKCDFLFELFYRTEVFEDNDSNQNISIECIILSNNFLRVSCNIGKEFEGGFRARTYFLNDDDYKRLIDKLNSMMENSPIYNHEE